MAPVKQILFIGTSRQTLLMMSKLKKRWRQGVSISLIHHHSFWLDEVMAREIIGGTFGLNDIRLDLPRYLKAINCDFIHDRVTSLLPYQKKVMTDAGRLIHYDVIIFDDHIYDEYSEPDIPVFGHFFIKPSYDVLEIKNEIETLIELNTTTKLEFVVLGGGREGLAYALQLEALLKKRDLTKGWSITIIEAQACLLPNLTPKASKLAKRFCKMANIKLLTNTKVMHIQSNRVVLSKGATKDYDLAIRSYPEYASRLFEKADLITDERGRLLTNTAFQVDSQPEMFALGDSGRIDSSTTHYISANQQVSLMVNNISAYLKNKPVKKYPAFKPTITMLPLGVDYGMLVRGERIIYGKWCLKLINWIHSKSINRLKAIANQGD